MYSRTTITVGVLNNVLMTGLLGELKIEERVVQGGLFTRVVALQYMLRR